MTARCNRLDRQISFLLGISRDDVRLLLAQKRIKVDGLIADSRELLVDGFSCITLDDEILQTGTALYLMLHKPRGILSATTDEQHATVLDLIDHPLRSTLHIAGRLDLHASGLMLLTNDGQWSRRLSAPTSGVEKVYLVTVQHPLDAEYVTAFQAGMFFPFENITTRPACLEILDEHTARVTLQEGRYHQIKRMFGRFRNPVLAIHRISIGGLMLDAALAPGASRELRADEVESACPGFTVRKSIITI
jgi:16S rRNA pseudouridine516 synthase